MDFKINMRDPEAFMVTCKKRNNSVITIKKSLGSFKHVDFFSRYFTSKF